MKHEQWSSRMAFLLAAVGSAVGLGNIWRFPYVAGENGGGAFVLIYIGFVLVIGVPVLVSELVIGRKSGQSPINSIVDVAKESASSKNWKFLGWLGTYGGGLGLLSFYSVIAGWVMAYVIKAMMGMFDGIDKTGTTEILGAHMADGGTMMMWHMAFIALTVFIVGRGINAGLEKAVTFLMPVLFLLLLVLVGYSMATADFARAVEYLFTPDFSKIDGGVVLSALGQALFSLSVTVGTMLAYGAYLPKDVNIMRSAGFIAAADTGVALIAGLAIFPLVFTYGLEPTAGPSLIFEVLPVAFGEMPGGTVFGAMFFILLTIAALTSSISLLEPAVSFFEERKDMNRWKSAIFGGGIAFAVGTLTVFSNNEWSDFYPLAFLGIETIQGDPATFFKINDFAVSNLIMPLSGLGIALFVGWAVKRDLLRKELGLPEGGVFEIWHVLIKFVVPIALAVILVTGLI